LIMRRVFLVFSKNWIFKVYDTESSYTSRFYRELG
jgi:hypothetical protein